MALPCMSLGIGLVPRALLSARAARVHSLVEVDVVRFVVRCCPLAGEIYAAGARGALPGRILTARRGVCALSPGCRLIGARPWPSCRHTRWPRRSEGSQQPGAAPGQARPQQDLEGLRLPLPAVGMERRQRC